MIVQTQQALLSDQKHLRQDLLVNMDEGYSINLLFAHQKRYNLSIMIDLHKRNGDIVAVSGK
jgi:hypothetical protein